MADAATRVMRVSWRFSSFAIAGICWLMAFAVWAADLPDGSPRKVEVRERAVGEKLEAQGAQLIADYGSYQLYEVPEMSLELLPEQELEVRDDYNVVMLHSGWLDTRRPELRAVGKSSTPSSGKRMHLLQFAGPVQPEWRDALTGTGVRIISYIPQNTYLVYGDTQSLEQLHGLAGGAPHVQWDGAYLAEYKIHPSARPVDEHGNPRPLDSDEFAVQLARDPETNPRTVQLIDRLKLGPIRRQQRVLEYLNLVVRLAPESLELVAAQPDVVSIQLYRPRAKTSERQAQIIAGNISSNVPTSSGYLAWLAARGFSQEQFDASAFIVDLADSGIDNGTVAPSHFGLYQRGDLNATSRIAYARLIGTASPGSTLQGCDGHGTLNAHLIGGFNDFPGFPHADALGYQYGLGVCPFVRLGSSVIFDPDAFTDPDYTEILSRAYREGARISNNSWGGQAGSGGSAGGGYDIDAQTYDALVRDAQPAGSVFPRDGNQEMVVVFAAGNDGPAVRTMQSPGTAKNVITVGASENVHPFGGADSSGVPDAEADNANDMVASSGRGPCVDGRHKPDLVAPGTHVTGGVVQAEEYGATGLAAPCFTGDGISGGVQSLFFPPGQEFFTASSGTSHATAGVSGGCALLRQFFINRQLAAPSPAMTKAYLINSARHLTGANANDSLWSDTQGMGAINLGTAFDARPRILRDQAPEDLFTASGQTRVFSGAIAEVNAPFRVTLAWTDAPGSTTGNAFNNNLDLAVTVGGRTYKGNSFHGAFSAVGGAADTRNNVESVFLPSGSSGRFVVTVTAVNINSDGVPNNVSPLDQDFALVIYNARSAPSPVLATAGFALLSEACLPTNGVIDPGETVSVRLFLQNVGTRNTTNLIASLQGSSNLAALGEPQNYGALLAGANPVGQVFSFTANAECGQSISATLQLRDGPLDLGRVAFDLRLGGLVPATTLTENFDGVLSANLPDGWSSSASDPERLWNISRNANSTTPTSAFAPDPNRVGISDLTGPSTPIRSENAELVFRHSYSLDADRRRPTVGYDGGVLEIQIGNGPFVDILEAGGSFVTGGYNRTLSSNFDNPLAGRLAWSGSSGGFVVTRVVLPVTAAGREIVLRWRCGTDNSTAGAGWLIDSISILDAQLECCATPAPSTNAVILRVEVNGTDIGVHVASSRGLLYTLEYKNSFFDRNWIALPPSVPGTGGVIVLHDPTGALVRRFYRVNATAR